MLVSSSEAFQGGSFRLSVLQTGTVLGTEQMLNNDVARCFEEKKPL